MLRFLAALALVASLAACASGDSQPGSGRSDAGPTECASWELRCDGACVDPATHGEHCGECGTPCDDGTFCAEGSCVRSCPSGLEACGASCVDPENDTQHCGGCDQPCDPDEACRGGTCGCPEGYTECDGVCVDPDGDRNNCGVCGRTCDADQVCSAGSCTCASSAREVECLDGEDGDCDGLVDCEDPDCEGATRACEGECGQGIEACDGAGGWGACEGGSGEGEVCGDGIDQDCDGEDLTRPDDWEPNDACSECRFVSEETDPSVFLDARFDSVEDGVDCYRFRADDVPSPVRESIEITLENIPEGHDYDLYLYRTFEDCEARTTLAASAGPGDADEKIRWSERFAGDDGGTYYVRVVRYRGHSCDSDYRLTIRGLLQGI